MLLEFILLPSMPEWPRCESDVWSQKKKARFASHFTGQQAPSAAWVYRRLVIGQKMGQVLLRRGKYGYAPPPDLIIHTNRSLSKLRYELQHICGIAKNRNVNKSVGINTTLAPAVGDYLTTAGQPESKQSEKKRKQINSKKFKWHK